MIQTMKELNEFFKKRETHGIKPGLERTAFLLNRLDHPEKSIKLVHVAGTNGKGSTIRFMETGLRANGYDTGVFTSPSFSGICGHFFINEIQVSEEQVIDKFNSLWPAIHMLDQKGDAPTNFEILTVLAFLLFKNHVDVALIETGMGGRFDTTNCFIPSVAIITNIAIDHTDFLGESIAEIAYHKAGIIKQNRPVVLGELDDRAQAVITQQAHQADADIFQLGRDFTYQTDKHNNWCFLFGHETSPVISLAMKGRHQQANAAIAMTALQLLEKQGIPLEMRKTLAGFRKSKLPGRFEIIHHNPLIILDSAHNPAGLKALIDTMKAEYNHQKKKVLFAGFKDKRLNDMLSVLDTHDTTLYLTTFNHKRAATLQELSNIPLNGQPILIKDWKKLLMQFRKERDSNTVIYITGSLHFITFVRDWLVCES